MSRIETSALAARFLLQIPFAPLRARKLAALIDLETFYKMPLARDLPGRNSFEQMLLQAFDGDLPAARHRSGDNFSSACLRTGNAEYQAIADLPMREQYAFDRFRRDFSAGHVDLIIQAPPQKHVAIDQLS